MTLNKISKGGSWTHKNVSKNQRPIIAKHIRKLRQLALLPYHMPQDRSYKNFDISRRDLETLIRQQLIGKKKINILDSGAGHFYLASDIKKSFKNKVNVTGITLRSPFISQKSLELSKKVDSSYEQKLLRAKENARTIDSVKVGLVENIKRGKKYEMIIDLCGPFLYSKETRVRVLTQYAELLKPNGIILVLSSEGHELVDKINSRLIKKGFILTEPVKAPNASSTYMITKKAIPTKKDFQKNNS